MSDTPPNHTASLRGWALGLAWVAVSGIVVGWFSSVHTTLRDHDQRIPRVEQRSIDQTEQLRDQASQLRRMETKLDKLLERHR